MFKCSSIDGKMNPEARRSIDNFVMQSKFREKYPDKAKAIQGMTVPSPYCESMETMLAFANEKIEAKKLLLEKEKKYRESIGAPTKFDKYGKYKY